jgi:hypothetical protein
MRLEFEALGEFVMECWGWDGVWSSGCLGRLIYKTVMATANVSRHLFEMK